MIHKTILIIILTIQMISELQGQHRAELYSGWNHIFEFGIDLNHNLSINPKVGQQGSSMQFGFDLILENINIDHDHIFENHINVNIGLSKNPSDIIEIPESNTSINPISKNYDDLEIRSKYSRLLNNSNLYVSAEHLLNTKNLPSYTDNYLKSHTKEIERLGSIFSPMTTTQSIGIEKRNEFTYSVYFSPLASKLIYVADDDIAKLPAINISSDSIEYLGSSLHGNEMTYNTETNQVESYSKSNHFLGAMLNLEFNKYLIVDKLFTGIDLRFFYNYNKQPKHLDISGKLKLQYSILSGLSIGISADYIKDDNLIFQSSESNNNNTIGRTNLVKGASYTQRFVINYLFGK